MAGEDVIREAPASGFAESMVCRSVVSRLSWASLDLLVADEAMGTTWSYLDMTALGRQESWEDSPEGYTQTPPYKWWNWHDNYDAEASPHPKWVDIITDPQEAARRRAEEEKAS